MAMNNIRFEGNLFQNVQRCFRKKYEPFKIIIVVPFLVSVEMGPVVEILPFNKINRHPLFCPESPDSRLETLFSHGDFQVFPQRINVKISVSHCAVKGQDEPDIHPKAF